MSAGLLRFAQFMRTAERQEVRVPEAGLHQARGWSPEEFARAQVRGLVRQVFFSQRERPVRQVVFSSASAETDVRSVCLRVAEALALETRESVAVAGEYPEPSRNAEADFARRPAVGEGASLRKTASRLRSNLWRLHFAENSADEAAGELHRHLSQIRREFEYSVVEAPQVGAATQTVEMAQFADGLVLVLSAEHTRRVTAYKIKEMLQGAQVRMLGTVLCDREFPIPEGIYRRL